MARERQLRPVAPVALVAERLESLVRRAQEMPDLDPAFARDLATAQRLASGLEPYVAACTTPESTALASLAADTRREDWDARFAGGDTSLELEGEMLSGHVEGQFLRFLVRATRAARVLEIGCFTGYSALAMAEGLPDGGELVACELDPYAAAVAERAFARSPHGAKIRIVVGRALDTLRELAAAGETFDLVFVDADKPSYRAYLELALAGGLLARDGLACVDNTLLQGQPYLAGTSTANGRAIADFNRALRDDPRVEQVLLPVRDGLTLVRRV